MTDIGEGHNSAGVDSEQLRAMFDRIVSEETRKREIADNVKDLYAEAKSAGFDVPALRETVKAHFIAQDEAKKRRLAERDSIAAVYANALQIDLPF